MDAIDETLDLINRFDRCWPMLEPAMQRLNGVTREQIRASLVEGTACLWATKDAAIVTETATAPGGAKTFIGILSGGDFAGMARLADLMAVHAAEHGIGNVRIAGDSDWADGPDGFQQVAIIFERTF